MLTADTLGVAITGTGEALNVSGGEETQPLMADSTRARLVDAAAAEMRADAQAVADVTLTYLEPLVLPGMADRWIENGGTVG